MRHILYILTILLTSCFSGPSDKESEEHAVRISHLLDNESVKTFYKWNYFTRGGDNWSKISHDSMLYTCSYLLDSDTTTLVTYRLERFVVDFPCSFKFDTATYWRFSLKQSKDDLVTIEGVNRNGQDIRLTEKQKLTLLFSKSNPFKVIGSLNKFKDMLGVIGIASYENQRIGNFIQFYISRQHILTYIPDTAKVYNEYWKKNFATGKMIGRNWNYRKLKDPIDNG